MPLSAYPEGYQLGPDNQSWLMRLKFWWFQVPLTGGPRVPSGFWKFREIPKLLFGRRGEGQWRVENTDGSEVSNTVPFGREEEFYLSRIQPWCRWHFTLVYPLGITGHIFWKRESIVPVGEYKSDFGIKRLFAFYLGWVRDGDKIYKPSVFFGGNFE